MESKSGNHILDQVKQAPIWGIAIILIVVSINQSDHNKLVRMQIESIHDAQLQQIKEGRDFETRITERAEELNLRIAQLEVKDEMWDLPIYKKPATGDTYLDTRR